jgi:hypothetical protein
MLVPQRVMSHYVGKVQLMWFWSVQDAHVDGVSACLLSWEDRNALLLSCKILGVKLIGIHNLFLTR